jgi:hypothetical protein
LAVWSLEQAGDSPFAWGGWWITAFEIVGTRGVTQWYDVFIVGSAEISHKFIEVDPANTHRLGLLL